MSRRTAEPRNPRGRRSLIGGRRGRSADSDPPTGEGSFEGPWRSADAALAEDAPTEPGPPPFATPGITLTPREPEIAGPTLIPDDTARADDELDPGHLPLDPLIHRRIGLWVVDGIIGRAQGRVLVRAHHHHTDRIRGSLSLVEAADDGARAALIREGEILFAVDHPNLPRVRNLMPTHDPPYVEFELLRGEPLSDVLARRRALFLAEALELVEQLLGALVVLHRREVFHRDIQPANVLVGKDGVLTLTGFAHAAERSVQPNGPAPTPMPYLPPEWPDVTRPAQADLYAVGCLLFELLSGARPFGAPLEGCGLTQALVRQAKAEAPFLDPGSRFQEDLRTTVRHLTTREPAGRVGDAQDALARVQAVQRTYA